MNNEQKNPNPKSEHEKKNEGGREFGHVHDPTQAQQASKNQGHAGNQPQQGARPQQSGAGSTQGSQQGKPPGSTGQEQRKTRQEESKSA